MRKLSRLFAVVMAFAMVFSFSAVTQAAEAGSEGALKAQAQATGSYNHGITNIGEKYVGISVQTPSDQYSAYGSYQVQVIIYNHNKKPIQSYNAYSYASFNLPTNRLYYYRTKLIYKAYGSDSYIDASGYSNYIAFTCSKVKSRTKYSWGNGRKKVTLTIPKIKGLKKCKIYVSTKKNKGYKKVKTVKTNKKVKVTLKKFKGKSFKTGKTYYIRVMPAGTANYYQTSF